MKYHSESEYDDKMQIMCNREEIFEEFISNIEKGKQPTNKDIILILREMQEYLNLDFPYERSPKQFNTVNAFELVCRVAIALAEKSNDIDTYYINNKLFAALKFLRLDN